MANTRRQYNSDLRLRILVVHCNSPETRKEHDSYSKKYIASTIIYCKYQNKMYQQVAFVLFRTFLLLLLLEYDD